MHQGWGGSGAPSVAARSFLGAVNQMAREEEVMKKTMLSIDVLGLVALLFTNALAIETVKPSRPDSAEFQTITIRDSVTTGPGESLTVFADGRAIPGERFNKELLHTEYKDGWERIGGVLRWPKTLTPAVAIRVGFARRDSVDKKIEILCFEMTD